MKKSEIIGFLNENNLIKETKIKNIDHSCCNSNKLVIDFDNIANRFVEDVKCDKPKSVDCLLINDTTYPDCRFYFIEMKDCEQIIERLENPIKFESIKIQETLTDSFKKFSLEDKIIDSFNLFIAISGYYGINKKFYKFFYSKSSAKILFYFLINISSENYLLYNLKKLANVDNLKFRFLHDVDLIRAEDFDRFFDHL